MRKACFFAALTVSLIIMASHVESNDLNLFEAEKWEAPKEANNFKNPVANNMEVTVNGKKLYEKICWSCHGKTGKGDGPAGVNLKPSPANHTSANVQNQSDGSLFWKISKGRNQMPSYEANLSEKERWALVNHIRTLAVRETKAK